MSDQTTIYKIHQRLQQKIKRLDEQLITQLESTLGRIDQIRYHQFSECLARHSSIPDCYQKSQALELRPDLEREGSVLQVCLGKMGSAWERGTDKCFNQYEKGLRKTLESELNRVLKLVQIS